MIGRERELELLTAHLGPGELVALVGPSGVGKTTIAEEVARRHDDALFVDCYGLDAGSAAIALASAAGIELEQSRAGDLWVRAAEALIDVPLVVLDDVRFDLGELARFRRNFAGPVLVTCHEASGDATRLPIAGFHLGGLGEFEGSSAFAVFMKAARRANLKFELDVDDIETVYEISRRTDGYPLALSLAGRRAASTSPQTVLDLLDDPDTLTDPSRPLRHQSLQAALDFSWRSLELEDQRRMYAMSLFNRPLPPRMLAEVLDEPLPTVVDGLDSLVGRGLVAHGSFPRPLEAFVELAERQYEATASDAARIRDRVAQMALAAASNVPRGLAEHADFDGDSPSLWQFVLGRDDHGLSREQLAVVLAAWLRWATLRGLTFEQLLLSDRVLALLDELDHWIVWFAAARHRVVEPIEAAKLVDRAARVARDDGERQETHLLRGYVLVQLGQIDDAKRAFDEARSLGDFPPIGHVFEAELHVMAGDEDAAQASLARAGDPEAFGVISRAYLLTLKAWLAPTASEALRIQQRVVELCAASGQLRGEAAARQALATLLSHRLGRHDEALDELERARVIAEKSGDSRFANRARASAVAVLVVQQGYDEALLIAEEIVGTGDPAVDDSCYLLWLIAKWQLGDRDAVREEWAKKELVEPPAAIPPQDEAWAVFDVAMALDQGDPGVAAVVARHVDAMPATAPLLDAMLALAALQPASDFKTVLQAWMSIREVHARRDGSLGVELCWRLLLAEMPPVMFALQALEEASGDVRVLSDYQALIAEGEWHDLSTQPVSQRLLQVLVEADAPLDHDAVGAALYPDEIVVEDAMKNRIDVQVSKLRKLGLRPYLAKRPDGFVLEGDVFVATR